MAEADDASSTIVWIRLRDALALAVAALDSVRLAKKLLRIWLAEGKLPRDCKEWRDPDAKAIEGIKLINGMGKIYIPVASTAYHKDDPQFWLNCPIDWENDMAHDNAPGGAEALGVKVSHTHLLALLSEGPRERVEAQGASEWITDDIERMKQANKISPDITITELSRKLERRMTTAAERDKTLRPIKARSIENALRFWGLFPVK